MAAIYVDNNGSNTSPYDTWAKAATTLNTALNAWSTGDVILVNKAHTEGTATVLLPAVGTGAEPIPVYSADPVDDSYSLATANTINATDPGADFGGVDNSAFEFHGLMFNVNDDFLFETVGHFKFVDCTFKQNSNNAAFTISDNNNRAAFTFENCTFSTPSGNMWFEPVGRVLFKGCVFDVTLGTQALLRINSTRCHDFLLVGCDLRNITPGGNALVSPAGQQSKVRFINCEIPASMTISANNNWGSDFGFVEITSTDDAGTLYRYEKHGYRGIITTQTGDLYRTSGYVDADGNTNASHKMVPLSTLTRATQIVSPMLTQYISTTGSKTLTVHAADTFTTAPNKNQLYIEVFHLNAAGDTLWSYGTSRDADILATTALTPTAGEWTDSGAALNNEYKMEKTINIARAGYIGVNVVLQGDQTAETANAVYYDPKIEIS